MNVSALSRWFLQVLSLAHRHHIHQTLQFPCLTFFSPLLSRQEDEVGKRSCLHLLMWPALKQWGHFLECSSSRRFYYSCSIGFLHWGHHRFVVHHLFALKWASEDFISWQNWKCLEEWPKKEHTVSAAWWNKTSILSSTYSGFIFFFFSDRIEQTQFTLHEICGTPILVWLGLEHWLQKDTGAIYTSMVLGWIVKMESYCWALASCWL